MREKKGVQGATALSHQSALAGCAGTGHRASELSPQALPPLAKGGPGGVVVAHQARERLTLRSVLWWSLTRRANASHRDLCCGAISARACLLYAYICANFSTPGATRPKNSHARTIKVLGIVGLRADQVSSWFV